MPNDILILNWNFYFLFLIWSMFELFFPIDRKRIDFRNHLILFKILIYSFPNFSFFFFFFLYSSYYFIFDLFSFLKNKHKQTRDINNFKIGTNKKMLQNGWWCFNGKNCCWCSSCSDKKQGWSMFVWLFVLLGKTSFYVCCGEFVLTKDIDIW